MRKCKYKKCENTIDSTKRKEFCSKRCWTLHTRVIKTRKCARQTCENTFKVLNGAKQYCSIECRKKGVEKSEEQRSIPGVQNRFNHDYHFIFSNQIKDWMYSPRRAREERRQKKKLNAREED
jgi:hypothetical protein